MRSPHIKRTVLLSTFFWMFAGSSNAELNSMSNPPQTFDLNTMAPRLGLDEPTVQDGEWIAPSVTLYKKLSRMEQLRIRRSGGLGFVDAAKRLRRLLVRDGKVWVEDGAIQKPLDPTVPAEAIAQKELAVLLLDLAPTEPKAEAALKEVFGLQLPQEQGAGEVIDYKTPITHSGKSPLRLRDKAPLTQGNRLDHVKSFIKDHSNWEGISCKGDACTYANGKSTLTLEGEEKMALARLLGEPIKDAPKPEPVALTDRERYDAAYSKAVKEKKLLFVYLGQNNCPACVNEKKILEPMLKNQRLTGDVVFTTITKENDPELFNQLKRKDTDEVPQLIVMGMTKEGTWKQASLTGNQSESRVVELLDRARTNLK
jgi:glutaredoxin